ncbi:MAG: two-component regulator propeller domain-containing protein [Bacteroidales bacterium]
MSSRYILISFLIFYVANIVCFSQQHVLINYSLEDGLPQSSVLTIYQDSHNNIWLGTQGGVSKFNGNTFLNIDTRHGLADNHINTIFQDDKTAIGLDIATMGFLCCRAMKLQHFRCAIGVSR